MSIHSSHSTFCYCLVTKSCPTFWDPMECSPPGSSVHGISQAWILEWVAIFFSRGSSWPRDRTQVSYIGRTILQQWATWEAPLHCSGIMYYIFTNSNALSTWWLFVIIKYTQIFLPSKWYIMFPICLFMLIHTNHWLWNVGHNLMNLEYIMES